MYNMFNPYLSRPTWYTNHENDGNAFYDCLSEIVNDGAFNPDDMGAYMRQEKNIATNDYDGDFAKAIAHRVTEAWAIKGYLERHGA